VCVTVQLDGSQKCTYEAISTNDKETETRKVHNDTKKERKFIYKRKSSTRKKNALAKYLLSLIRHLRDPGGELLAVLTTVAGEMLAFMTTVNELLDV